MYDIKLLNELLNCSRPLTSDEKGLLCDLHCDICESPDDVELETRFEFGDTDNIDTDYSYLVFDIYLDYYVRIIPKENGRFAGLIFPEIRYSVTYSFGMNYDDKDIKVDYDVESEEDTWVPYGSTMVRYTEAGSWISVNSYSLTDDFDLAKHLVYSELVDYSSCPDSSFNYDLYSDFELYPSDSEVFEFLQNEQGFVNAMFEALQRMYDAHYERFDVHDYEPDY